MSVFCRFFSCVSNGSIICFWFDFFQCDNDIADGPYVKSKKKVEGEKRERRMSTFLDRPMNTSFSFIHDIVEYVLYALYDKPIQKAHNWECMLYWKWKK